MKRLSYLMSSLFALIVSLTFVFPIYGGSKKMMSINGAKVLAERAIVESVIGLKIKSSSSIEDMVAVHHKIDARTTAAIKGIEYVDTIYDREKDIAKVTAQINVGRVINVIGKDVDFGERIIQRVGFATSTKSMAGPLRAMRAAEMDAYKQLAKEIVGFKIDSTTTVENYILKSDIVKTKMMAAIWGAKLVGYRWDDEGDAYVKMSLRVNEVEDVLDQKVLYDGKVIEAEGTGAQKDDFTSTQIKELESSQVSQAISSNVREESLDIPVSPQGEVKGKAKEAEKSKASGGAASLQ